MISQSTSRGSCSNDLLCAVSVPAEYAIVLHVWRSAKIGVDVLPHQFAFAGHLEKATEVTFTNEGVAIWQALGVRNPRTEEFILALLLVFPDDLLGRQVNLYDPRKRYRMVQTVRPIIEDEQVAIRQRRRSMLTTQGRSAELPDNLAGFSVDNDNRRDRPKTHHDVAVW